MLVVCLGLSQLVAWGAMHYLIAVFAGPIQQDLGWSAAFVQSGFSLALLTMGLVSYAVGSWIDRHGGRLAMMAGCWCGAAACALIATAQHQAQYLAGWVAMGIGMRLALYDAAFAALAHIGGLGAKRAMAVVTLFGGLASTAFWPLGQQLLAMQGWRGAIGCYALILVGCSLLHLVLPRSRAHVADPAPDAATAPQHRPAPVAGATVLYGFIAISVLFLQTAMAAHFLALLRGSGWGATQAVALATLLGIGQVSGRTGVVLLGHRADPVRLNLLPSAFLCLSFTLFLGFAGEPAGAAAFAFLYGAGNGLATITRGSMPLVLFDSTRYGRTVGAILRPAFVLAAAAPVVFAWVIERTGVRGVASLSLGIAPGTLAASALLAWRMVARQDAQ